MVKGLGLALILSVSAAAQGWVHGYPSGTLRLPQPPVGAFFSSEFQLASVRLKLDGQDLSGPVLHPGRCSYLPPQALAPGRHWVHWQAVNQAGTTVSRSWSFVVAPEQGGSDFEPVGFAPPNNPGGTLEINFSGPVREVQLMVDEQDVSRFVQVKQQVMTYKPPRPFRDGAHRVHVLAYGQDGGVSERTWGFFLTQTQETTRLCNEP